MVDKLRRKRSVLQRNGEIISRNYAALARESHRVADLAHNAMATLDNLDDEFERQTGLDRTDWNFLLFATSLQTLRWVIIAALNRCMTKSIEDGRLENDDSSIKAMENQERNRFKQEHDIDRDGDWEHKKSRKYPTWLEIVFDGVPYDVTRGSSDKGINMQGGYHRIHTLGHDPLFGWIFGVNDIIASTITLNTWDVYVINREPKPKRFGNKINIFHSFARTKESIDEDWHRLPAAVFAQWIHLKSDINTKLGLPIPVLESFDPDLAVAGKLYKEGYDSLRLMKDIAVVGTQAATAIFINLIIGLLHGLYYDSGKYDSREVYEVKTRKILLYSNMIASASNLIWVGGNVVVGNGDAMQDLDVGGLMVTAYRFFNDRKFIREIKEEFVFGKFKDMIQGDRINLEEINYEF